MRVDGTYIYDLRNNGTTVFHAEMRINQEIAIEMCKAVNSVDFSNFMNKGYVLVQQRSDSVFAVYKHDFYWWLCKAKKSDFVQAYGTFYGRKRLESLEIPRE